MIPVRSTRPRPTGFVGGTDGDLDLCVTNDGPNKLMRNDGAMGFVDYSPQLLSNSDGGQGAAWADYDDDGDLDLYLANNGQANCLFKNLGFPGAHNWLKVRLEGSTSNRSGIGARIRIVAGGASQIREISGGFGYGSQEPLIAHFGVGAATTIDTVEVTWPAGGTQRVYGALAQTVISLHESSYTGVDRSDPAPAAYCVYPAIPNPFNPVTQIRFDLPVASLVNLRIYSIGGRLVRTLHDHHRLPAGRHSVSWNGTGNSGRLVASGVYFYVFESGDYRMVRRLVLIR